MRRFARGSLILVGLALALLFAGCGDDGGGPQGAEDALGTDASTAGGDGAPGPGDGGDGLGTPDSLVTPDASAPDDAGGTDATGPDGAELEPDGAGDDGATDDAARDPDAAVPDVESDVPDGEDVEEIPWDPTIVGVGPGACCLGISNGRAVWAEGGDLFLYDVTMPAVTLAVDHPAVQTDPAVSGDLLVWADDRSGNFDLWMMKLPDGEPQPLVVEPGDQDSPSLDGSVLAWIDRRTPPHGAAQAEVWLWDLVKPKSVPKALTDDDAEQADVHVSAPLVVWSDYRNDPDKKYVPPPEPNLDQNTNNADIAGWDIDTGKSFWVTQDPNKQIRPATDGLSVVWLDWRGISPEPKFSKFKLFGMIAPGEPETELSFGSWTSPYLWVRPQLHDGTAVWVTQPLGSKSWVRWVDLAKPKSVHEAAIADEQPSALALTGTAVGWIEPGKLVIMPKELVLYP